MPIRRCSLVMVVPSSRVSAMPSALCWASRTVPKWTSKRSWASSLKRWLMSSSKVRRNGERFTTVTLVPSASKTWANSIAMKPPPTIVRDLGSSGRRMMSSLVWKGTAFAHSGMKGRDPAAITIWSAEIVRASLPMPVEIVFGATNRACWSKTVTLGHSSPRR